MEPEKYENRGAQPARSVFGTLHPAVELVYFAGVLGVLLVTGHPVLLGTALVGAMVWGPVLNGKKALRAWGLALPVCLLAVLLSPLFSHAGATILLWLPGGNPLTRESVWNGLGAGVLLGAAVGWFFCLDQVMTTDKLVCLFGRAAPALSLLLAMTLRFVPRFAARAREIHRAQRACGYARGGESRMARAKQGLHTLSILITWALESSIVTADSMNARGYGLPGRTAYSLYRFDRRDALVLGFVVLDLGLLLLGAVRGDLAWTYYPVISGRLTQPVTILLFADYAALCALPLILEGGAAWQWKRLH